MKTIYLILILIHGAIHSLGFLKGFGIREINELSIPVSRGHGVLWLITSALFLGYGILYFMDNHYAWVPGLLAVALSQVLVILFWQDARFGTIVNVTSFLVCFVGAGSFKLHHEFSGHVKKDFSVNNTWSTEILTEADIANLPSIVQKYLHYTKSVGQPRIKNFKAEFTGGMRSTPGDDYMKVHSVQYNFLQNPSRYFLMGAKKTGLPAKGLHIYHDQRATFQVKLLNWFKVVDAKGEKLYQGETVTLFNDMCIIAPATLIDERITWEELNATTVRAHFNNRGTCISATLHFNEMGELQNFISNDRYETNGKEYINHPWATPLEDYKMLNGYLLPGRGRLIYHRPEGDFTYGELEFKDVRYNLKSPE